MGLLITLGALTVLSHVHPRVALARQCNALVILSCALVLADATAGADRRMTTVK